MTPKTVASSEGATRETWLVSITRRLRTSCKMETLTQVAFTLSDGFLAEALDSDTTDRRRR